MEAETETELKLVPRLLDIPEFCELIDPSEVMLRTAKLVWFGCVVAPSGRSVGPTETPVGRRPVICSEVGVTSDETRVSKDHDVSGVCCGLCEKCDAATGIVMGNLPDPFRTKSCFTEASTSHN